MDMKTPSQSIVHGAIGLHLGIDPTALDDAHLLADDLGLDALELVMIAIRLEDLGLSSQPFPFASLEGVATVGDVVGLFRLHVDRDTVPDDAFDRITLVDDRPSLA
jgi:acyl carrier protein